MLKWPPDSGWWFETFCRWQGFSDREVKSSYYVPRIKPCINIHAWGGDPLETGWPPCGLNPIYWMLPLTKSQSLSSPSEKRSDLNKRFPEHQIPKPHFCFLAMTSFADLQHVTALKLVNASPFTGTVWCLVNDARMCCWRIASTFPVQMLTC